LSKNAKKRIKKTRNNSIYFVGPKMGYRFASLVGKPKPREHEEKGLGHLQNEPFEIIPLSWFFGAASGMAEKPKQKEGGFGGVRITIRNQSNTCVLV
jgi:hypothetical protein